MRIVVLGATGATGRHVVAVALRRGHAVVALARRPAALSDLAAEGLEVRQADVHQPETVTEACRDAEAVISALGTSRGGPTGTLSAGARAVAAAAPPRLAWMGSFGVGHSQGRAGPLYEFIQRRVLGDGFADKAAADDLATGPRSTVFHPVILTSAPATAEARLVPLDTFDRSWRFLPSKISRAGVAAAMVTEVEMPAYAGSTVAVL